MTDVGQQFLAASRRTLSVWMGRIETCVAQLTPDQIWWRGAENSNAVGNILLQDGCAAGY